MDLLLARLPHRLNAAHPRIIENLLEFAEGNQQEGINAIIEMLTDLHTNGNTTRYAEKLQRIRIWELKTRSRGGTKGGARVYFYWRTRPHQDTQAVIVNAELKDGDQASPHKLREALEVLLADEQGIPVTEPPTTKAKERP